MKFGDAIKVLIWVTAIIFICLLVYAAVATIMGCDGYFFGVLSIIFGAVLVGLGFIAVLHDRYKEAYEK